jgi:hypothetical protein
MVMKNGDEKATLFIQSFRVPVVFSGRRRQRMVDGVIPRDRPGQAPLSSGALFSAGSGGDPTKKVKTMVETW